MPEKYDGKNVWVEGYLHNKFEDHALYLSKEDADRLVAYNAVWVEFSEKPAMDPVTKEGSTTEDNLRYFDCRYVHVEGVFRKKEEYPEAYMVVGNEWAGELTEVSRIFELTQYYDGKLELQTSPE